MVEFSGKGNLARYARHLALEGWDQTVITKSHVIIIGVGALGCEIAKNLTLVGCGNLTLIDMDIIETSNLSRQMLFTENDRGKLKAEVAAEKLAALNPMLRLQFIVKNFKDYPWVFFRMPM